MSGGTPESRDFQTSPEQSSDADLESSAYSNDSLAKAIDFFAEIFSPSLDVVYYPGCSVDVSPSKAKSLGQSRVIYVDKQPEAVEVLRRQGLEAYCADATKYNPGQVDLLLLINFFQEEPLQFVTPRGLVMAQFWGGPIDRMQLLRDYILLGVINAEEEGDTCTVDTMRLNEYFEEVDTDEELQSRIPVYHFERMKEQVKEFFGTEENIAQNYQKLAEEGFRRTGIPYITPTGESLYTLPRKKDGGFFIYQRISKASLK